MAKNPPLLKEIAAINAFATEKNNLEKNTLEAELLSSALPYIQRYENQMIVIKYGGHAMDGGALQQKFARDIALLKRLKIHPIIVHGGGPQINEISEKMGIVPQFKDGLRISDAQTVKIAEMVLSGLINKDIVSAINAQGAKAIGLSGKDGHLALARKVTSSFFQEKGTKKEIDLGFVGEIIDVNKGLINLLNRDNFIPVIAPIAPGKDGCTYNVNGDTFAGAVASALAAKRLLFLTDVPGVLDKNGNVLRKLTIDSAQALIKDGVITKGMIPKVETCIKALKDGVEAVVILNGKVLHPVLLELFTEHGAGTIIVK